MTKQPLTAKEYMVLEFVKQYVERKGYAPTYQEIKDKFDFASFFSVQRYLKQLETKGYVKTPWGNKKRALQIMNPDTDIPTHQIPFLGRVAAGRPIEAIESRELIEIPADMIRKKEHTFALKVEGQSMIDDGIHDGDILVIQQQLTAENGQTVVAIVDGEATVKRFFKRDTEIELRPANPTMLPFFVNADRVTLAGIVVGLIRKFK